MKKNVNPIAIVIAVVAVVGFCYFMYQRSQPDLQAAYDARNGPPAYATKSQAQAGGPPTGYQHPGQ